MFAVMIYLKLAIAGRLLAVGLMLLFLAVSTLFAQSGPLSPLSLTGINVRPSTSLPGCNTSSPGEVNVNEARVIQGANVINSWILHTAAQIPSDPCLQAGNEAPLAVSGTVRTIGASNYCCGGNPENSV